MRTLTDNEQALAPEVDAALDARHQGDLELAKSLCYQVLSKTTDNDKTILTGLYNELGYIYNIQEDFSTAAVNFRNATLISPQSETSLLSLFFTLIKQNLVQEALQEAIRFLSRRDSSEYRLMLTTEGAFRDDLAPPARALADMARQLLDAHSKQS